mmetsp:Transcript_24955/g.38763  ORF Transcript_24955/g.38763 Transcript_24955/m.38763 type:complete len:86 (+) Transcript_24955:625-882(+)
MNIRSLKENVPNIFKAATNHINSLLERFDELREPAPKRTDTVCLDFGSFCFHPRNQREETAVNEYIAAGRSMEDLTLKVIVYQKY